MSYHLLATAPGADLTVVGRAPVAVVPGSEAHTKAKFADAFSRLVNSGFLSVVGVLVGIGFVVGGAVIALTTYTATVEKARDFAVLEAVGASGSFVYRIVVWQSLLVGLVGALLGIAASALAADLISRWVPEFVTDLRALDVRVVRVLKRAGSPLASGLERERDDVLHGREAFGGDSRRANLEFPNLPHPNRVPDVEPVRARLEAAALRVPGCKGASVPGPEPPAEVPFERARAAADAEAARDALAASRGLEKHERRAGEGAVLVRADIALVDAASAPGERRSHHDGTDEQ